MAKPIVHARSSARMFGGEPEDYLEIHQFMDSSKGCVPNNSHRTLTHNSWFVSPNGPLERSFGVEIVNSDGRKVSVRSIGEQHIAEDFRGCIPTPQDFLSNMNYQPWFDGREKVPSSITNLPPHLD